MRNGPGRAAAGKHRRTHTLKLVYLSKATI